MSTSINPSVTIGMPIYNGAEFIDRTLAGLLKQTHRDFILIISDNASTDGTWEILKRWAARDDRIVLHRQDANIGPLRNFRYLLDQAETEFFMWHADDDWVAPNYLEELLGVFAAEPGCALASSFGVRVTPDGSPIHREAFPRLDSKSRLARVRTLLIRIENVWFYGLFRTETLRQALTVAEDYGEIWAFDAVLLLAFILNDQIRGTDRTVFYYRINYASLQSYRPDTRLKMLRFMARYLRFHFRLLRASNLSLFEKLLCWPWLLCHSIVSLFEHPVKRFVKHPIKRFVKAVWPMRTLPNRR